MALDASIELYEEALRKKDYRRFAEDCIQRAIEQAGREWGGSQAPGQGIGLSWTLTRRVAEKFANRNGSISLGNYSFIPVMFEADYESDWVSREPESAGSQYGYTPSGQPEWKYEEFEVLLRPGAPLVLKRVVVGVPANIRSFLTKLTQNGDAHTTEIAWVEVPLTRRVTASDVSEYGMSHRPADDGPPAYDLTVEGEWSAPPDIYDHPDWYGGSPESARALKAIRGNAQASVTIYRAGPKPEFNTGDWVSLSRSYAVQESMSESVGVWSATVPAKDVRWAGDSLDEFGYFGPSISGKKTTKVAMPMGAPFLHTNDDDLRRIVPDFPEWDDRTQGDCGPVAIAALSGISYADAVEMARKFGFSENGMSMKQAVQVLAMYRKLGRFTRQYEGTSLREYLTKRPDWTGMVLTKSPSEGGAHLMAVIKGWVFNGGGGRFDGDDVMASITVADWQKKKATVKTADDYTRVRNVTPRTAAKAKRFSDFERGMRVVVTGHPDHPGTVVRIHGQGNAYTKGYLTIAFDSAPDRPVQYPWREVEIITPRTAAKTWREKVDALPGEYTPAIMSAVENVLDEGYSEDDDEFWSRVYGEVMA